MADREETKNKKATARKKKLKNKVKNENFTFKREIRKST